VEQNESDNRRIIRYPDSHQLFVGNLPHDIDESELKEFFMSKYQLQTKEQKRCAVSERCVAFTYGLTKELVCGIG